MINTPVLGQRDPRWASALLGFGTGSIGNYGCTLTCLTSFSQRNNVYDSNENFKRNGVFGGETKNLVIWAYVPKAFPNLKFVGKFAGYDNAKVADYIYNKKTPVLVEVNAAPIGSPRGTHWILFLGDQKCLDPWTGQLRSTGDFPTRINTVFFDYVAVVDVPLTDAQKVVKVREILASNIGDGDKLISIRKTIG